MTHADADLQTFAIRGIREQLPAGEQVLWQGAPNWRSLARSAFHVRKLAVYFAAMLALRIAFSIADGNTVAAAVWASVDLAGLAIAALAVLHVIAWLSATTTFYAITNRRVAMRVGIALPIVVNLPLPEIVAAGLKVHSDGSGDMPLQLKGDDVRLAYAVLWPHVRRWHFAHPQPMMRAVPDGAAVADILAQALVKAVEGQIQWTAAPGPMGAQHLPAANEHQQPEVAVAA